MSEKTFCVGYIPSKAAYSQILENKKLSFEKIATHWHRDILLNPEKMHWIKENTKGTFSIRIEEAKVDNSPYKPSAPFSSPFEIALYYDGAGTYGERHRPRVVLEFADNEDAMLYKLVFGND
jgi:hypothetical protein